MAVIHEGPNGIRVTEIQPYFNAGILKRFTVIEGNINGVAEERLIYRLAEKIEEQKMHLMDVKCVQLGGAVFDDPILHVSLLHNNVWNIGARIEWRRDLSIYGEVKGGCTVGVVRIE